MDDVFERQLLTDFQAGKQHGFRGIHSLYYSRILVFAKGLILSRQEAEEIVNDSFRKLFIEPASFPTLSNIRSFLYITTKNSCFDYLKSSKYKRKRNTLALDDFEMTYNLELNEVEGEMLEAIFKAMEMLPQRCQAIMKMIHKEGLTPEEVSARLNISIQTVYSQKYRAIGLLKAVLADKSEAFLLWIFIDSFFL